jgi:hypothetical protein
VAKTKVRTDQLTSVLRQTFNNQSGLSPIFDFSLNGYSEAQQRLINSVVEKSSSPLATKVASVYPGDGGNTNIQFLHVITNKDDTLNRVPLAFIYDKPTVPGDNAAYGIYHIVKNDVVNPYCHIVDIRPVDTVNGTQFPVAFYYREGDPVNRTGKVVSARPFFVSQGVDSLDFIGYTVGFRSGGQASPYYSAGVGFYSSIAKTPLTIFSDLIHSRFDILGRDVTLDINTSMYGLDFRISNTTGSAKSFILNSGDSNNSGGLLTGCRMIFNASSGNINLSIGDKGNVLGYDLIFQAAPLKTLNITMNNDSYIYGFRTVFRALSSNEGQGTLNVNLQATGADKESIVFGYVFSTHSNVNFNGTDVTKHYVIPIRSYNVSNLNNVTWLCEEWMLLFSSVINSRVRVRDILINNATAQNFICDYLHPYGDITVSPTVEGFRWDPLGDANSEQAFNSFTATFIASSWDGAYSVYHIWRMRAEGTVEGTPLSLFSFIGPSGYSLRLGSNGDVQIPGFMTFSGISAPSVSDSGTGRIYFDNADNRFKVSENGGSYVNLVNIPGGPDTAIQFNDNGVFNGSSNLTWDSGNNRLVTTSISVSGQTIFNEVAYTWPATDGTSGQVLTTDGAGQLSWATPTGGETGDIVKIARTETNSTTTINTTNETTLIEVTFVPDFTTYKYYIFEVIPINAPYPLYIASLPTNSSFYLYAYKSTGSTDRTNVWGNTSSTTGAGSIYFQAIYGILIKAGSNYYLALYTRIQLGTSNKFLESGTIQNGSIPSNNVTNTTTPDRIKLTGLFSGTAGTAYFYPAILTIWGVK